MSEKNKEVDQFLTYSSEVGNWTTGTGAEAGKYETDIRPETESSESANNAQGTTGGAKTGGNNQTEYSDADIPKNNSGS